MSVVGDWPTASVVVTLRYLMEDLDTDYLAPADEAIGGVLDP